MSSARDGDHRQPLVADEVQRLAREVSNSSEGTTRATLQQVAQILEGGEEVPHGLRHVRLEIAAPDDPLLGVEVDQDRPATAVIVAMRATIGRCELAGRPARRNAADRQWWRSRYRWTVCMALLRTAGLRDRLYRPVYLERSMVEPGRDRRGTRQRLLDGSGDADARTGLTGAGINEIVRESGAPKGSVYHFFPAGKRRSRRRRFATTPERLRNSLTRSAAPGSDRRRPRSRRCSTRLRSRRTGQLRAQLRCRYRLPRP